MTGPEQPGQPEWSTEPEWRTEPEWDADGVPDPAEVAADVAYASAFITSMGGTVPAPTMQDAYYEEISAAAVAGMQAYGQAAARLAKIPVTGHSRDGRIVVQVDATGDLLALQLRGGALRWYDSATLGEVVTRTLRQTQERARERYQQEVEALVPAEVLEAQQVVQEALDRAAIIDGTATGA
jgi:DNA-binding protein YbaB